MTVSGHYRGTDHLRTLGFWGSPSRNGALLATWALAVATLVWSVRSGRANRASDLRPCRPLRHSA